MRRCLSFALLASLFFSPSSRAADDPGAASAASAVTQPSTTTQSVSLAATEQPETAGQRMLGEFLGHFSAYEPMYFIAGPVDPVAKWQVSFQYRLLNPKAPL